MVRRLVSIFAFIVLSTVALPSLAGVPFTANGPHRDKACWEADKAANRESLSRAHCYSSCSCTAQGSGYSCTSVAHKYSKSCDGSTTDGIDEATWILKHPDPRASPQINSPPSIGSNTVSFNPNVPNTEHAQVDIVNQSSGPAITYFEVWVRDTGYSAPSRAVYAEKVLLKPGDQVHRDIQQFRADPSSWNINSVDNPP